ncbi:MAG: glycosyltransferase family 4 protein [Candidatus Odinarchaeota archaeon]
MKKKKILQLRSSNGFFGAENVIIELSRQLSNSNYHPVIGVIENSKNPHIELAEAAERYNIETEIFKCKGQFDISTANKIRGFIKQNEIEIIHSHGYKANFYALLAALFMKVNLIATCHPWIKINLIIKFYSWLDKLLLNRFDEIVVISEEIKREILMSGVFESKITIINNGIDISRFMNNYNRDEILKSFDIIPDKIIIGTVGRLSEEKGHIILIEAAKKLLENFPNLIFMIVGDGPLRKELEAKVLDLGIQDHFSFTGISDDIPKALAAMDIFVLPSLTEGLPMALLEAMAATKPIIATDVGAIPKLIINGKNGRLIEPGDSNALIEATTFLLNNQNYTAHIAKKGYETVINKYSAKGMAEKYINIFDKL